MIKNVIFDIGKVLVSYEWLAFIKSLGIEGDALTQISENLFGRAWEEMDRCACDKEEMVRRSIEAVPDYPNEIKLIYDNLSGISDPFEYSSKWLQSVKDRGRNVYLLSNFGMFPFETLSKKYDFLKIADGAVISYQVLEVKPERYIYEYLLEKYNLEPSECVFIDDRRENIETAVSLGINGILFTDYEDAAGKLDELLA